MPHWYRELLLSKCMLPTSDGAAQGNLLMIWDARPFQDSEANLVSIGVSIWRRLAIKWYTLVQNLSTCRRSMSGGPFIWMRQGHMPIHPLKAWPFGEWWMPAASTGASTSSGAAYCWLLRLLTTWYRTTRYL